MSSADSSYMNNYLDDSDLVVLAGCTLAKTPGVKDSWIEAVGGELPEYICQVAKELVARGYSTSHAIATAVNTIKRWARGGTSSKSGPRAKNVHADTIAKAAKALAEWEALKAKAALSVTKIAEFDEYGNTEIVSLCDHDFSVDVVRRKFEMQNDTGSRNEMSRYYVREMWTKHLVANYYDGEEEKIFHVPYTVDGDDITFGEPIELEQAYLPKDIDEKKLAEIIGASIGDTLETDDED